MTYWDVLGKRCQGYLDEYGYENFKRTVGVVYNDYYLNHDTYKLDDDYEEKVEAIWDSMYKLYSSSLLDLFSEPLVGNPLGIIYKGRVVSIDLSASISEMLLLMDKIDFSKVHDIHEIGGGYGRLAYVIGQMYPRIRYKMYDIQPSLGLAERYLTDVSPNGNFFFHEPSKLGTDCDILIAMDCLHEMNDKQVNDYFDYADKHARFFYYTCWKHTNVADHGIKWSQADYPVRKSWKPLFVGQHRMRSQFFEALYEIK